MISYYFRKLIRRLPGILIKAVPLPEPEIHSGFGTRAEAGTVCWQNGYRSVLLITDTTLYELGFHQKVVDSLEAAGISCTIFSNISAEPSTAIVAEGQKSALDCNADCIIALGGGSVLDSSKVIAATVSHNPKKSASRLGKFIFGKTLPLITIPSTAGTGAEQTVGAVIKNAKGAKKCSVIFRLNVKDVILDSELTVGAPAKVTAGCGIDALSHGLEGCLADVRVNSGDMQKSLECVRLVLENLPAVLEEPGDIDKRQKLSLAANYGGNAINKQLAGYVHAFAHSIGALYHISHGEAIAHCLLPVVTYQKEICSDHLYALAQYCGTAGHQSKADAIDGFLDVLAGLLQTCGFGGGLSCIDKKDYPHLIRAINSDSINYSPPKTLSDKEIIVLLDAIKAGTGKIQ